MFLNPYNGRLSVLALRSGESSFIPYWRALKALRGQAVPGRSRCIAVADYATRRVKFNVTESTSAANTFHTRTHMNTRAHKRALRTPAVSEQSVNPLLASIDASRNNSRKRDFPLYAARRPGCRRNGICAQGHGKVKSLFSNSQRICSIMMPRCSC